MIRYAVVDIETTGLSPAYHHRILEVAVVLVEDDGNLVSEWETLVNPERQVEATEIHGLSASDVYAAPTFEHISGELASILQGRVPVSHNLSFDAPFLESEYRRLGYSVPLSPTLGLCTMRLASRYLSTSTRSLEGCCGCINYHVDAAHSAIADARASANLLAHYIHHDRNFARSWHDVISAAQSSEWPIVPRSGAATLSRHTRATVTRQHFLARLASRMPRTEEHPGANSYLALLDRALLDRQLSLHEQDELIAAANMMGLCREDAIAIHRRYLSALGRLALADGTVTDAEREDLDAVALMLGLTGADAMAALDPAEHTGEPGSDVGSYSLHQGDAIVFTGDMPGINREDLEYQARALGLRVTGSVSRKTSLVVAADPDSISGKARKARDLGVPIVNGTTYLQMLDSLRGSRSFG